MLTPAEDRAAVGWMLIAVGVAAAVAYSGFILAAVNPGDPDLTTVVSSLEAGDGSLARTLRALDVAAGVLTLVLVPFVHWALPRGPWRRVAVWSFATFAVAGIPAGLIALPCAEGDAGCAAGGGDDVQTLLHDGLSIVSTCALIASAAATALAVRREGPRWLARAGWVTAAVQVVTGGLLGVGELTGPEALGGISQRLEILGISAWIVCLSVSAATDGVRNAPRRRGRSGAPAVS
jgi:hypothetical protein